MTRRPLTAAALAAALLTAPVLAADGAGPPGWEITRTQPLVGTWVGTAIDAAGHLQPVWCLAPDGPMRLECEWHTGDQTTGSESGILYRLGTGAYNWSRFGNGEPQSQCDLFVLTGGQTLSGGVVEDHCQPPHRLRSMTIRRVTKDQDTTLFGPTHWILNQWRTEP